MRHKQVNIIDISAIAQLLEAPEPSARTVKPAAGDWIRILRSYLRMNQVELARRAKMAQSHIAAIETGKIDPQISTLRRIFQAMSCDLVIRPEPTRPIQEVLRGRARSVALKRLKQSMGTMALEGQAPEADLFRQLLEKRTDDILSDKRGRLWADKDD